MKYALYLGDEKLADIESCEVEQQTERKSDGWDELVSSKIITKDEEE